MLMDSNLLILSQVPTLTKSKIKIPLLSKALKSFLKGETGKFGNYVATKNALVYRTLSVVDNLGQDVLLLRLVKEGKVHYLGNSSRLTLCESKIAFGARHRGWRSETKSQEFLRESGFAMLPFDSFRQAGLKLMDAEILEQTGSETVKVKVEIKDKPVIEDRHFTGASLFKIGTSIFLFDIDREEQKHNIFNPFIVQIPIQVETIAQAYDALIPLEVRTAMIEGKEVKRQGEFFFIKVLESNEVEASLGDVDWRLRNNTSDAGQRGYQTGRLSAQGNRDHLTSLFNRDLGLVSGYVVHTGREHADLPLNGWFKPVPNTATRSFTLSGDVD